jgi:hypothetical protein
VKRAPASRAADSASSSPLRSPSATWSRGAKSNSGGSPHFPVVGIAVADRHFRQGEVGHLHRPGRLPCAHRGEFRLGSGELVAEHPDLVEQWLDVFAARLGLADFARALILAVLQFLQADLQVLALLLQRAPGGDVQLVLARLQRQGRAFRVGTENLWIQHETRPPWENAALYR